ncbi:MAG TPA: choice-of-anchor J domain-containing protein [Flavobacterium sp.]|jgi:hypothetical protein
MKTFYIKIMFLGVIATGLFTGCADEPELPPFEDVVYQESFETGVDNVVLDIVDWTNYAEAGTALWKTQEFDDNVYAEFSGYQTNNASNIAWLVSPKIELPSNSETFLRFAVSQSFVSSPANKLEVFISTDFTGDVEAATWNQVNANIPDSDANYFEFMDSGPIDLSAVTGPFWVAFRYTGSGTDQDLDGSYQIDDVSIYQK